MRTCSKCKKETMEDIDLLNSISRESKPKSEYDYTVETKVEPEPDINITRLTYSSNRSFSSNKNWKRKYDICRPCGEEEYKEEKEWKDARYEEKNGASERESLLRFEAYELGIKNIGNYPFEMLENLVKEEKKKRSEYRRGVWSKSEKPKKAPSFKSVIGVSDGKKAIVDSIVRPLQRPDLYPLGWNRCILMFGPPGTGKTLLASYAAQEIDTEFIEKDAAQIKSMWVGESEQNVARLFNDARNKFQNLRSKKPIIIFIDEVDALFGTKKGGCDNDVAMRNQFLKELDSLGDKNCNVPLYVIASTNKPWNLDFAFIRRFQKRVYVGMPDKESRMEMLKLYTSKLNLEQSIDFRVLSEICDGYSGSDIENVCRDAYQYTLDKVFESDVHSVPTPISKQDFVNAIERRNPSVSNEVICEIEDWARINKAN